VDAFIDLSDDRHPTHPDTHDQEVASWSNFVFLLVCLWMDWILTLIHSHSQL